MIVDDLVDDNVLCFASRSRYASSKPRSLSFKVSVISRSTRKGIKRLRKRRHPQNCPKYRHGFDRDSGTFRWTDNRIRRFVNEATRRQHNRARSNRPWYEILLILSKDDIIWLEILRCRLPRPIRFFQGKPVLAGFLHRFSALRTDVGVRFCHQPVTDQLCSSLKVCDRSTSQRFVREASSQPVSL